MMMFRPVASRGWAGRIVVVTPVEGVVGRVREVDPETHPYPPHLILGPAGKPSLASWLAR
jgi:hypothetical protein